MDIQRASQSLRSYFSNQQEVLRAAVFVALLVYYVFKRFEPMRPLQHFVLLIVPPAIVATVLSDYYSPALAAFLAFSLHYATILGTIFLYRTSLFHPLGRYQGPFLLQVSKLAFVWKTRDGRQYWHLQKLHQEYGDIVRIGPNEVSIRSPSVIAHVFGPNGLPKGPHWAGRNMDEHGKQLVSLTDMREHARRRRPWNRAFSVPALKGYEEIIARRAEQLVSLLARHSRDDDPADIGKCMSAFTYDFMSDMAFGGGSEQMKNGDEDSVWHIIEQGLAASQIMAHCPWLGIYMGYIPWTARFMKQLLQYCEQRVRTRLQNGSHSRDLFYYLSNEDGVDKVAPPFEQVAVDGALAVVAGSDTTSGALANIIYCLLTNPKAYERLQAEIDAFFPLGENAMDTAKHQNMPYLNGVINESMRLYPPVPSGSQRATTKETGGRVLGYYYIPPGTAVNVPTYTLHRDRRNFHPRPDEFWPERWLIAAEQEQERERERAERGEVDGEEQLPFPPPLSSYLFTHAMDAYLPFSYGPANCVGKALGMQQMRMALCLVLQKLRLRLAEGWDPAAYEGLMQESVVFTKPYLPVVVEVRKGAVVH